jgi:hypothetical protein
MVAIKNNTTGMLRSALMSNVHQIKINLVRISRKEYHQILNAGTAMK